MSKKDTAMIYIAQGMEINRAESVLISKDYTTVENGIV